MGVDKMKLLIRLNCWWSKLSAKIFRTARKPVYTHVSRLLLCPVSCESWKCAQVDPYNPFLEKTIHGWLFFTVARSVLDSIFHVGIGTKCLGREIHLFCL